MTNPTNSTIFLICNSSLVIFEQSLVNLTVPTSVCMKPLKNKCGKMKWTADAFRPWLDCPTYGNRERSSPSPCSFSIIVVLPSLISACVDINCFNFTNVLNDISITRTDCPTKNVDVVYCFSHSRVQCRCVWYFGLCKSFSYHGVRYGVCRVIPAAISTSLGEFFSFWNLVHDSCSRYVITVGHWILLYTLSAVY